MPIPTPKSGEERQSFINRCMGSDVMQKEFPKQKQRAAVCYNKWRGKGSKSNPRKFEDITKGNNTSWDKERISQGTGTTSWK